MSDTPNIQQIIQDQLDVLPDSVREAVDSQDWRRKVYDIGRKYSLKIDQLGALEQSTYYTMIGLIPSSQYISELVNQVGVGRDVASSLAKEIDDGVFEDIRSFIMEMDGTNEETAALLESDIEQKNIPSGAIPSREDLLSEIEAIGEPMSSPAPVVTFSPIDTQLSKATASKPVDLNPVPAVVPTPITPAAPVAPILPEAPKPAPVEIPLISFKNDDAGLEFTETTQGTDKEETPSDTQMEQASAPEETLDLDSEEGMSSSTPLTMEPVPPAAPEVASTPEANPVAPVSTPIIPVTPVEMPSITPPQQPSEQPVVAPAAPTIPTPDGKVASAPISTDPYLEQF